MTSAPAGAAHAPVPAVVAVDVGGTAIKAQLVDGAGVVRHARTEPTPAGDPDAAVAAVRAVVRTLAADAARAGIAVPAAGVVVPGEVDTEAGVARYSANIGWRDVPLRDLLATDIATPVALGHDVAAAALAERELGAAAGLADCTVVVIGTGIASVSTVGGRVRRGAHGGAGELGHVPVRPGGEICACGQRGCLEAYSSARAVATRYAAARGGAATSADVVARLDTDPVAARIWHEAVDALADALVGVTMLDDPERIVLAGGLSGAGDALLEPLRAAVTSRLAWRPAPLIEASPLGARAGRLGAALLAWRLAGLDDVSSWRVAS